MLFEIEWTQIVPGDMYMHLNVGGEWWTEIQTKLHDIFACGKALVFLKIALNWKSLLPNIFVSIA